MQSTQVLKSLMVRSIQLSRDEFCVEQDEQVCAGVRMAVDERTHEEHGWLHCRGVGEVRRGSVGRHRRSETCRRGVLPRDEQSGLRIPSLDSPRWENDSGISTTEGACGWLKNKAGPTAGRHGREDEGEGREEEEEPGGDHREAEWSLGRVIEGGLDL